MKDDTRHPLGDGLGRATLGRYHPKSTLLTAGNCAGMNVNVVIEKASCLLGVDWIQKKSSLEAK